MSRVKVAETTTVFNPSLCNGRTAFITGGASGICLGLAHAFLRHGGRVAVFSRSQQRIDAAVAELRAASASNRVLGFSGDVRNPDALAVALQTTRQELGPIHVVVAGAAGNFVAPAEKLSPNGFKTVVDIDLLGCYNTLRLSLDYLKETRGLAMAISATFHYSAAKNQVHCAAAKAGIDAMLRTLALEWGTYGIRTAGIAPGPIAGTVGMQKLGGGAADASVAKACPIGSMGEITDIEHAFLYLVSPGARYVTGHVICVDGGCWLSGQTLDFDSKL